MNDLTYTTHSSKPRKQIQRRAMKRGGKKLRPIRKVEQGSEAWLKQKLTIWFSKWIRKRDPFCYCGAPSEVVGHFFCRWMPSVEYHEDNALGSCNRCNEIHIVNREPMRKAVIARIGPDRYADLERLAHEQIKLTFEDLESLAELYKPKERE